MSAMTAGELKKIAATGREIMADVRADTSTSSELEIGTSVYGTIGKVGDRDWYRIELEAGKSYEFRLHGMGIDQVDDTFLRLRDAAGVEVTNNDQSNSWTGYNTHDSRIVFTATTSGVYYLDAATYLGIDNQPRNLADATTGGFLLTAVEQTPEGMVFTPDEIAWQLIDNGNAFFGDEPAAFQLGEDKALTVNIAGLTTEGQALAVAALRSWTDVTGIKFKQTTGAAEITFDDTSVNSAFANPVFVNGVITSSTVNVGTGWLADFGTSFNSYSYETYIHEIGHALGFGHGGNYNGSATYGEDNYYLNDSLAYSIMSYMQTKGDEFGGSIVNTFVDADFRYMLTPAVADIIAIQNLYGDQVQTSTRKGDTTYGYNSNTGNAALDAAVTYGGDMFICVYDDGGKDLLDFSQASVAQVINLNALAPSNVLGGKMNLFIARGTVVENAFGGSAGDTMTGNRSNNALSAFEGADALNGGGGNDVLKGGAGLDHLVGGIGKDRLAGGADMDTFFFRRGYGRDVITDFDSDGGAANQDFIEVLAGATFDIEKDGRDTVIDFGKGSTLTLLDVKAKTVTEADFVFLT